MAILCANARAFSQGKDGADRARHAAQDPGSMVDLDARQGGNLCMEPHAHRRNHDHHRLILPGLIAGSSAAWTAVIAVDAFNLPEHVWHCTLAIAAVSTNACLLYLVIMQLDRMNDRLERGYQSMVRHRNGRPPEAMTPGPWPALHHDAVPRMRAVRNGNHR